MRSPSLTQLSIFVVIVCLASFFVSADQTSNQKTSHSLPNGVLDTTSVIKVEEPSNGRFTFSSLDSDNNGRLSQQEVHKGKNNWLVKAFVDIDTNADKALTEQELVDFAAKVARNSKSTS